MCIWPTALANEFLSQASSPGCGSSSSWWKESSNSPRPTKPEDSSYLPPFGSFIIHDFGRLSLILENHYFRTFILCSTGFIVTIFAFFPTKLPPQSCAFSAFSIASNNFLPQHPRTKIHNNWKPLVASIELR